HYRVYYLRYLTTIQLNRFLKVLIYTVKQMDINVINSIMGRLNEVNQMIVQAIRYGKDDVVDILEASSFGMGGNPPKNTPLIAVQTDRGLFIVGAITQKLDLKPGESALHGFS